MNTHTVVTRDEDTGDLIVGEEQIQVEAVQVGHAQNLTTAIDPADLDALGAFVTEKSESDKNSRTEWEDQNERAMKLLGIGPESDPDDIEYESANTSNHPLLLAALTRFQANAYSEMLPPDKVCTATSAFDLSGLDRKQQQEIQLEIEAAKKRVEAYYKEYLLDRLPCYEEDTDLILRDCGLHGVGFRKVYVDPTLTAPVRADYVPVEDLFIAYNSKNPRDTRVTHRKFEDAHDIIRLMQAGVYAAADIGTGGEPENDSVTHMRDVIQGINKDMLSGTEGHTIYETHCRLFLPEDRHPSGLSRPYVVTTHKDTGTVLAVRRNWVEHDPDETPIEHFVAYPYHPGKSAVFALGLGALLSNPTESLRDGQRAGLDAAYLANHPAGFKKSTMSIREDNTRVKPGEFIDVDSPGAGSISDMLMLHPFRGPDPGLMTLMDKMELNGKELGGVATADLSAMMGASVAPGPALAAFDEQTKFQSAVHRRIYRAHRRELNLVHQRMREIYGNQPVSFGVNSVLDPTDLILIDILPAMDPSQANRGRRMIEAQVNLDTAEKFPDIIDQRAAVMDFLAATGSIGNNEHLLLPEPQEAQPKDAISEYMEVLKSRPIVAGPAQNHMAHIDTHVTHMQGVQSSNLPTEQGAQVMASLSAHIAEHMALDMAVQVAAMMGIPLSAFFQGIPPEIEHQIAPQIAKAVQAIEELRKEPDPEATKVQIEQIRAQNKLAVEQLKGEFALAREQMQSAQNAEDNQTQTLTNREDNATALLIAGIKGSGGGQKPNTNPTPSSGSADPNPKPRARPDQ